MGSNGPAVKVNSNDTGNSPSDNSYTMHHTPLRQHFNNSLHLGRPQPSPMTQPVRLYCQILLKSLFLRSLKHKQRKNIASEHKNCNRK